MNCRIRLLASVLVVPVAAGCQGDSPDSEACTASTAEDGTIVLNCPGSDPLVVRQGGPAAQCGMTDNGDGSFDYDPQANLNHLQVGQAVTDTVAYLATDNSSQNTFQEVRGRAVGEAEFYTRRTDAAGGASTAAASLQDSTPAAGPEPAAAIRPATQRR